MPNIYKHDYEFYQKDSRGFHNEAEFMKNKKLNCGYCIKKPAEILHRFWWHGNLWVISACLECHNREVEAFLRLNKKEYHNYVQHNILSKWELDRETTEEMMEHDNQEAKNNGKEN